ncbi:amino acid adenylation domain-containing protein [Chitinophaga pendula]|uniref:non-ribosomal peptide synthetase n=1 Tax=Chitinophaga TaxID=79328 RepID=UPI0018E01E89|nr:MULTISPECIES: non-ribosomal peptide synthetase [Chitinophaga]UCJ04792.1 amino acid adenylation domain-containing protein [Chitinophaga pendula]
MIWLDHVISAYPSKYNIGGYVTLTGHPDHRLLSEAFKVVVDSQEVYGSLFSVVDNELTCTIGDVVTGFELALIDLSGAEDPVQTAMRWMEDDFLRPFVIEGNYLFRMKLLKVAADRYYYYAVVHHLIGDGWSFMLLLNQAAAAYQAKLSGEIYTYERYAYSEYCIDDEQYLNSNKYQEDKNFWLSQYATLPADLFPRRVVEKRTTSHCGSYSLHIDGDVKRQLEQVAATYKASVFQILISLLLVYLGRTQQQDIVPIAMPVLNRPKKRYKATAGVFMNLVCMPFVFDPLATLADIIRYTGKTMYQVLRHQQYQYGNLVGDLHLHQLDKRLYHVRVSYEDFPYVSQLGDLLADVTALSNTMEIDPLSVYIRDYHGRGMDLRFIYHYDYLQEEMIAALSAGLTTLIHAVIGTPEMAAGRAPLLPEREQSALLGYSAGVRRSWPQSSFAAMWGEAVTRYPDRVAITTAVASFTYVAIHEQAIRMAALLRRSGIREQSVVALVLPRDEGMVSAMIGCMLAGMTYMPVDPDEPDDRIMALLEEMSCDALCTSELLNKSITHAVCILTEGIASVEVSSEVSAAVMADHGAVSPAAVCYILCTSGTTGRPKGVAITHAAMSNYVSHFHTYFGLTAADVVLQQASVSFDTSVEEIFPVLAVGGRLHIVKERRDLSAMSDMIAAEGVTVVSATPLVLQYLPAADTLRVVISGGDVLRKEHIQHYRDAGIPVYNTYGPTETTVCATYHEVKGADALIPVGQPISNCSIYVLDAQLELLPVGTEGEIYIGGAGLAVAYLNDPLLYAQRFIDHPFVAGEKLYRTGDSGKWVTGGELVFTGRRDEQVKIRGIRVEPGETEGMLKALPGVRDAVVTGNGKTGWEAALVAFVVIANTETDIADIQAALRGCLPDHLLPQQVLVVDELPLTMRGKVDKRQLYALLAVDAAVVSQRELVPPVSRYEVLLVEIWQQVLEREDIGITDNFFELGGHSLNANMVINKIYQACMVHIKLTAIFTYPTIRALGALIALEEDKTYDYIELC